MNNLRKFATEAEYSAATLNYPAVSWIVSGDTLHYDISGSTPTPPTPTHTEDVMMAFTSGENGYADIVLWNYGATDHWATLSSMTINEVDVTTITEQPDVEYIYMLEDYPVTYGETYVVVYGIYGDNRDYVSSTLSGDLGGAGGSHQAMIDFYLPSTITLIENFPSNIENLVVNATTPPTVEGASSGEEFNVYVPDESVDAYKEAWTWMGDYVSNIHPISEYSGLLPV